MSNFFEQGLNEASSIINQMSTDELQKLMGNEAELNKFVRNLSIVQQTESNKESLKTRINRLALNNLDKEPILTQEKQKLFEVNEKVLKMKSKYNSIRGRYDDEVGETNPEIIYALLQTAASDFERSTEQSADDFFYGSKTEEEVTEFERRFVEDRKRAHELKIKADKFRELMHASQATSYLNSNSHMRSSGFH